MSLPSLIPVGAWLWDNYGGILIHKAADTVKDKWKKFRWNDAANQYRGKIKRLYGTMQIMGMAEPMPLDEIFTDLHLLDKPTAFARFDIEYLKQLSLDPTAAVQAERVNGLRLVTEKIKRIRQHKRLEQNYKQNRFQVEPEPVEEVNRNLFILGKPGAGKTTFLKYIALKAAEQTIDKVPIFISLKEWADSGDGLLRFITKRFDICGFPDATLFVEELLKSKTAIALFDGLDEVNQDNGQRDLQTTEINNFVEKYDYTQCLITCRIAASDYSFKPFTYVEVADFTMNQVQTFVGNWFRQEDGNKDNKSCQIFFAEFNRDENRGLKELARIPLLLTLLCLAFNETLTFPRRRVEIYEEALDALLKKWDSSRRIKRDEVYRKLSLGHKEHMLERIAAETFEKNQYFIPQLELEKLITEYIKNVPPHDLGELVDGEPILKAIEAQHGVFVERAHGIYSFSHLTFQEYLTAKYIVNNAAQGTLKSLVGDHCGDSRWREVFLLTTSLLPDASELMSAFRRELDYLHRDYEKLQSWLTWAEKKSSSQRSSDSEFNKPYRFRERALNEALDRSKDQLLAKALNQIMKESHSPNTRANLHFRDLDRVQDWARELGMASIAEELAALSLLLRDPTDFHWQEFRNGLKALIAKHKMILEEWHLTTDQENQITVFMKRTRLLMDCLDLATMPFPKKNAILNSLYLPVEC